MKLFSLSLLAISAFCYPSTSAAYKQTSTKDVVNSWESVQARHLSPAYPQGGLRKRRPGSILQKEASLDFVDHTAHLTARSNDPVFVTNLNVGSQHPILLLEDLEDGLHDISCSESGIKLSFDSAEYMEAVSEELMGIGEFVAISSHLDCNEDEQRAPHMITKVTVDKANNTITLSRTDTRWEDALSTIDVSFSRKRQSNVVRRSQKPNNSIKRRYESSTASSTPTMQFPSVPSYAPNYPTTNKINVSYKNKTLVPPGIPGASLIGLPEGITLSCKDCTLSGGLELSDGSFRLNRSKTDIGSTLQFIAEGEVALDVSGIFARMELELALDAGKELLNFSAPFPSIPLTPFAVPGIVQFGAIFTPQVSVSVTLSQPMNFSYGLEVLVPKDSSFNINLNEIKNSTAEGFEYTKFTEIPFQSSHGITDLTFAVSFSPQILLGIGSPTGQLKGGAGVTFNMPHASVKLSQLDGVDENCETVAQVPGNQEGKKKEGGSLLDSLVGNFTNVVPKLDFSVVPFIELGIRLPNLDVVRYQETTVAATQYSLPTACLAFDKRMSTYGAPSQVLATTTAGSTGTALPDKKKAAAVQVSMTSGWISLYACLAVAAIFTAL
ncbi:uncharacterized protein GIQ15_03928 [Arthroderma uncinatum]|uniref:uncharacterized protein n=1 Tax=Arthroderma uncinatum TaxID=74035 RepID=UPI00144AF4A6|nr:uncharacterized protein GIQ15_03928 [Arthroderma uncinatum]KAF3481169.1 hypothetical protein GIQ15_03928 [Arthroderma uncinatum]